MISIAIFFAFCSVWCLYATAKKVALQKRGITLRLSKKPRASKWGGLGFLLLSISVLYVSYGYAVGIILAIALWMIVTSAIVLFAPFPKFNAHYVIPTVLLSIVLDLLLHYSF